MIKSYQYILSILLIFTTLLLSGKERIINKELAWEGLRKVYFQEEVYIHTISFAGAVLDERTGSLPVFLERFSLDTRNYQINADILNLQFDTIPASIVDLLDDRDKITEEIFIYKEIVYIQKKPYADISFVPIRKNPETGTYEKLVAFDLSVELIPGPSGSTEMTYTYAENSILASGSWYKLSVDQTGIYKISYQDLENMGINTGSIDPRNLRIYGNGNGMLPEANGDNRYDDLMENAIYVNGEEDGSFDESDYILFYGLAPTRWRYNSFNGLFEHELNLYTDHTFYFLNTDLGPGKRIQQDSAVNLDATHLVTSFTDYAYHEEENINILKTGKIWFGELLKNNQETYDYDFNFPNAVTGAKASLRVNVAARSTVDSDFDFMTNGENILNVEISKVNINSTVYAWSMTTDSVSFLPSGDNVTINVRYNPTSSIATGWINYLELNARRKLIFTGGQLAFRDNYSLGSNNIAQYNIENANQSTEIWEVTDKFNITSRVTEFNSGLLSFKATANKLREFVAFDGSGFLQPTFVEEVENQNLHGIEPVEYIIVSHPLFLEQAQRIANIHAEMDNMSSVIVTPGDIYNEFSSGAVDPTAIRDFCRMLYYRADSANLPRYLLLFGDGSFDPKNRNGEEVDFIPAFQSRESLKLGYSFVSDDYYALLDPTEGSNAYGKTVDLGVGRFPVHTVEQATQVVDKIEHYISKNDSTLGSWRNNICFIADDQDNNVHIKQGERLQEIVDTDYKEYNINKIYFDAFQQISTPSGHRYPEVTEYINDAVENGSLIVNYTGHGGELGWSAEKVLEIQTILAWRNINKMPVFITATCEFSRFDDHEIISAGEWVILNHRGGGVGLFTTTRLAWSDPNFKLNRIFYYNAFEKRNGEYPRLGDLVRISKTEMNNSQNIKNFVLLGDPALKINIPQHQVETTSIMQEETRDNTDTVQSLSRVTVEGLITDEDGNHLTNFNGYLFPVVFDKKYDVKTLGNDGNSQVMTFEMQDKVLFKGKNTIKDGEFSFSFFVPRDIFYNYGLGKMSYYAYDTLTYADAHGYEQYTIGGINENAVLDLEGPQIELFINDTSFESGDYTTRDPLMIAYLSDKSGINFVGNGIGHEIIAYLDNEYNNSFILNDHFIPDIDSYQGGKIEYQFEELEDGIHTLHLKAWDNYNNSSEKTIQFIINSQGDINLTEVYTYPNPFANKTNFNFRHQKPGEIFDIQIDIYNLHGQLVCTLYERVLAQGQGITPIEWDGTTNGGERLSRGAYIYKMKVRDSKGMYSEMTQKLIIGR